MVSRAQRTPFGEWWWTVDKLTLAAAGALMLAGVVLSLAASPPVASRLGLDPFYFVNRHILYLFPAIAVMLAVSFLNPRQIRRLAIVVFALSVVLVALTPVFGAEIKGARRWLTLFGMNVQPSEFLKPAFVILIAWLFGESAKRPGHAGQRDRAADAADGGGAAGDAAGLRPDHADRAGVERAVLHGRHARGLGVRPCRHRRHRPDERLLHGAACGAPHPALPRSASGDTFNIDIATESFMRGGWFGLGPGEGTVKRMLPESHTDFVFAVAAEEFGVALCLALVALFAFIVIRALMRAMRNDDPFTRFAAAGLAILFGIQAAINMAVNLHLIPAKGMTLPFISYGGSSMISLAYAMGMLLALTREQPRAAMLAPELIGGRRLKSFRLVRQRRTESLSKAWPHISESPGSCPARAPE